MEKMLPLGKTQTIKNAYCTTVFPQPKQGLSEDEEGIIATALSNTYSDDIATKLLNKIKSIRPQKQWKPSKEQINALSITVKHGCTDDKEALEELLEQLKSL